MTGKLILMRHAKSDWADENLSDHDRPLNARGRRDAPRIAAWLDERDHRPSRILCSTAERTRETTSLLLEQWGDGTPVNFCESLYLAAPETMLNIIASEGASADSLLVLAHNPGISMLASGLAGQRIDMPTAAAAVFRSELDSWDELRGPDDVTLIDFVKPRAL